MGVECLTVIYNVKLNSACQMKMVDSFAMPVDKGKSQMVVSDAKHLSVMIFVDRASVKQINRELILFVRLVTRVLFRMIKMDVKMLNANRIVKRAFARRTDQEHFQFVVLVIMV